MKKESVTGICPADAKKGTKEMSATVSINAPETAEEALKAFGSDAVLSNAMKSWIISIQNGIRSGLRKGETAEQLQAKYADAKMGVAVGRVKVDPMQAIMAQFATGTPEEKAAIRAKLTAMLK